ncbi:hypothetical protein BH11MYX2_BH11MYX2_12580 [soil metagenome]
MRPPHTVYRTLQASAPATPAERAHDEFRYGAKILYVDGSPPVNPVEVEGVVVHSTVEEAAYYTGTSNPMLDHVGALLRIGNDKHFEAKLLCAAAPDAFARTELVSDVWPQRAGADASQQLAEIEAAMHARYPRGFVLKPTSSFATDGKFPSNLTPFCALHAAYLAEEKPIAERFVAEGKDATEAHLELNKLPSYPGRVLDAVLTDPETVIIQERLDIAQVDDVADEYRVHVVSGRVLERGTEHRWDNYRALAPDRVRSAEALVDRVIARLPVPYDRLTYGVDVVRLTDDSFRIMELNAGWESQYFYAEYDIWVANRLASHYAGAPTPLLAKFATFEQAPSVSTRLAHLQSLLAHPALANAERSALSEILAQAARVLVTTLAEAPSEEHLDVLVAIDQFDLTPFLSRAELAVVTRARHAAAA